MRGVAEGAGFRIGVVTIDVGDVADAAGDRGDVDGGVAAADHHDPSRWRAQAPWLKASQEFDAGDAVFGVGAGNRQAAGPFVRRSPRRSRRIRVRSVERHILANAGVRPRLHAAEGEDAADLARRARRAACDSRGCRSASCRRACSCASKIVTGMALEAQIVGGGEAAGPPPITATLLAGRARAGVGRESLCAMAQSPTYCSTRVDADEIVDLVAVAAVFAGRRADAAHHRREGVGLDHALESVFLPVHVLDRRLFDAARDVQPAADVVARRAVPWHGGVRQT